MSARFIALAILLFSTVNAWSEAIKLLPHQQLPIDYLIKNSDVKGLIVNHYMGTGKTYLGVGFAEHFEDKSIVILAPRFIESHWRQHLKDFPVKDPSRYEFVSYNDALKLLTRDLSNTIIVLDEVHNLIKFIKSADPQTNRRYSDLYVHLRGAFKILALSGTPIYNDEYDFAYLTNLVSGQDLMPFNEEQFRIEYTQIKKINSFWRGYVFESNILKSTLPMAAAAGTAPLYLVASAAVIAPITIGAAVGSVVMFPVVTNWLAPVETQPLRTLNANKFTPYISKYVSFYEIANLDLSEYPTQAIHPQDVAYNAEQFWFFLNFAEKSLGNKGLARMYKDIDANFDQAYLTLNTTVLQNRLADTLGSGREIGNFDFEGEGSLIEAPKFVQVLQKMRARGLPKSVIYSNYFENGTLAFGRFLDRNGLKGSYEILSPELAPEKFAQIVQQYNEDKIKILLLHPEITEGISLKGTRQFHLLEPVTNLTVQNQVVARAVRYQSHNKLPQAERHVDVYVWKAVIGSGSLKTLKLQKANWFKRYSEMSDWSNFGQGISQIDKNYDRKRLSPDATTYMRLESVNQNMDALKGIMRDASIEKKGDEASSVTIAPWKALADDEKGLELDPIMLPKTNFKFFSHFGQELLSSSPNLNQKITNSFGINVEIEVPLWENFATGFYFEDYKGQATLKPQFDKLVDPAGEEASKHGQNVLGFGSFLKTQFRLPRIFGDSALSLRVPFGVEFIIGQSLIPLYSDLDDLSKAITAGSVTGPALTSAKLGYGLTTGATLGLEFFPFEFVGLYAEGGYRMAYHTFPVSVTKRQVNANSESTFEGFRGYMLHGFTASAGIKLTY